MGLYVSAEISGREVAKAKSIPREALHAGNRVYVVKDGALDIRVVDVAHTGRDLAVISSGLQSGEQVVVSPMRDPINGLRVEALDNQGIAIQPGAEKGDRS